MAGTGRQRGCDRSRASCVRLWTAFFARSPEALGCIGGGYRGFARSRSLRGRARQRNSRLADRSRCSGRTRHGRRARVRPRGVSERRRAGSRRLGVTSGSAARAGARVALRGESGSRGRASRGFGRGGRRSGSCRSRGPTSPCGRAGAGGAVSRAGAGFRASPAGRGGCRPAAGPARRRSAGVAHRGRPGPGRARRTRYRPRHSCAAGCGRGGGRCGSSGRACREDAGAATPEGR